MTNNSKKKNTKVGSKYLKNHKLAFGNGWLQIIQTPLSSLTTCLIIAMTLVLAITLLVSLHAFKHVASNLHANNQVTFYLKANSRDSDIQMLQSQLQQNDLVLEASYTSAEQALRELASQNEFKEVLQNVQDNPLPPVLLVSFKSQDRDQIDSLVKTISQQPLIESVQLNSTLLERLLIIIKLGNRVTYIMAILLAVGILFIISHAVQEATSRNYQEMVLADLMGATTSYIRRPFLYVGSLLGFLSGLIAVLLICVILLSLRGPLDQLLFSYNFPPLTLLQAKTTLQVTAFSTFLGWIGSWISFYKYAKLSHN